MSRRLRDRTLDSRATNLTARASPYAVQWIRCRNDPIASGVSAKSKRSAAKGRGLYETLRVYSDRIACGDRDRRDPRGIDFSCVVAHTRESAADNLRIQPQTVGNGDAVVHG